MSRQYLDVPYRTKDEAKALGARFDGTVKRWYVEAGTDLVAFAAWLPAGAAPADAPSPSSTDVALTATASNDLSTVRQGIPLSRLLNGVATAVAQAFAGGVWTLVEVAEATIRGGHVYLDLSERDSAGQLVAKARATLWASNAARILPEFERATGAVIGAGIKLLVRAKPVFKSQYGFSLEIDAIDAEYTLGDLEARKKEIRARLLKEGVFERNRQLPTPWDYRLVLVVAPPEAAGLGDFQKEAGRLAQFGVCRFVYAHSRFQGEGAAREIVTAAASALAALATPLSPEQPSSPDAIVFIRGGGAANDLAWLNDYALARFICDQTIPVLTGIGHERDSVIPDEVAHLRFDTPSKVIAGIEQQAVRRAQEARSAWETLLGTSAQAARSVRLDIERRQTQIRADARDHLARARQDTTAALNAVQVEGLQQVHGAARRSLSLFDEVRSSTARDIATARQRVPALMTTIRLEALTNVGAGRAKTTVEYNAVLERSAAATRAASQAVQADLQRVVERATGKLQQGRYNAQALMREITGQGPEKTLARGFAMVRTDEGEPVTSSVQASKSTALHVQFRDGTTAVQTVPDVKSTPRGK